jgi:hypothetical protein
MICILLWWLVLVVINKKVISKKLACVLINRHARELGTADVLRNMLPTAS